MDDWRGWSATWGWGRINSQELSPSVRAAISRVTNIINTLAHHSVPITDTILAQAYDWVIEQGIGAKDLLTADAGETLVAAVAAFT